MLDRVLGRMNSLDREQRQQTTMEEKSDRRQRAAGRRDKRQEAAYAAQIETMVKLDGGEL